MIDRVLPKFQQLYDDQVYNDFLLNCTTTIDAKSYITQNISNYTKIVIQAIVSIPLWEGRKGQHSRVPYLFTLDAKEISIHDDKITFDYQIFNVETGTTIHHIEIDWDRISCVYEHKQFLETIVFFNTSDAQMHFA